MKGRMACLVGFLACAESQGDKTAREISTLQKEHDPARLVAQGRAYAAVGDVTRAEQYFSSAIESGADSSGFIGQLIEVCVRDGRYRLALDHAENHLRKHPNDAKTRMVSGTIYFSIGEIDSAELSFREALRLSPNLAEAHFALGNLLLEARNNRVEADAQFREYLKLSPKGSHVAEAQRGLLERVENAP